MMKRSIILTLVLVLSACTQTPEYQLAKSTNAIKEIQILDPGAPERNDGKINSLHGKYGEKLMSSYEVSAYNAKSARQITQQSSGNQ